MNMCTPRRLTILLLNLWISTEVAILTMAIKYFDFVCDHGHKFEGSFPSLEEMHRQVTEGLVHCPICDTPHVCKIPSASRLGTKVAADQSVRRRLQELSEHLMTEIRKAADKAEDVGEKFAEESRRMSQGLSPKRLVKGQCSIEEAEKLRKEGINVLPVPESSGKTLN